MNDLDMILAALLGVGCAYAWWTTQTSLEGKAKRLDAHHDWIWATHDWIKKQQELNEMTRDLLTEVNKRVKALEGKNGSAQK